MTCETSAQTITPADAKRLAEDTLLVMETVDKMVASDVVPEPVPQWVLNWVFDRSTGKLQGVWSKHYPLQESSPLWPYALCGEALLELTLLKGYRVDAAKEPSNKLWAREAKKRDDSYFRDKKPRCEQSIKTGKFPERKR